MRGGSSDCLVADRGLGMAGLVDRYRVLRVLLSVLFSGRYLEHLLHIICIVNRALLYCIRYVHLLQLLHKASSVRRIFYVCTCEYSRGTIQADGGLYTVTSPPSSSKARA